MEPIILIRLRRQNGERAAIVMVSPEDAEQAQHRWHLTRQGYAARRVLRDGKSQIVLLHREILGLRYGDARQGDHVNGDRWDYRRANLRIVTPGQNAQNAKPRGGSSRFRGVCWSKQAGKWMAYAALNGQRTYLGFYECEQDAADAARDWRLRHMTHTNEDRHVVA